MTDKLYDRLRAHQNKYLSPQDSGIGSEFTASFVIPVFNSASSIRETVASIENQESRDLVKEVVLINDGSDDESLEVIKSIQATSKLNIVIIDNGERKYAAFSRNRGIENASGDLVCFIDSDIILPRDYLKQHMRLHQKNYCVTFSLRCNISNTTKVDFPVKGADGDFRQELIGKFGDLQDAPFDFSETHTLSELCLTCAVTYRRNDLLEVKGCPENFVGWGFNDTAMAAKVISLGRSVIPVINSTVYHLEHAPRSGKTAKKWAEFAKNKQRYQKMLQLPTDLTFQYNIEALDY